MISFKDSKNSGTDIDLGNKCSKTAFSWAKRTFIFRKKLPGMVSEQLDGSFSNIIHFGQEKIAIASDGIGTKIELAERCGVYNTLGYDLVAMVCDDLIANGVEPTSISNILDVDYLDHKIVNSLMEGLYNAARFAKITVTGGEIAELGSRISGFGKNMHFNWCSTALGYLPKDQDLIDGSKISKGDCIIALKSKGFRSNGFSKIRSIMEASFGENWHEKTYEAKSIKQEKPDTNSSWGQILLSPSLIYSPVITKTLNKKIPIHGIAHITGGGIIDNLSRVLEKSGFGADIYNVFKPQDFMIQMQKLGEVPDKIAYRLWNMGNGMLVIVPAKNKNDIIDTFHKYGYFAQVAGQVISDNFVKLETSGLDPDSIICKL
ncbi:MAG: AIR synthase-related protein [Pseudomonadota bacterium]